MRILVIGGTRFIGPAVVRGLITMGHTVAVFHRGRSNAGALSTVPCFRGDRQRLRDFRNAFARFAPEVVVDMAPATEEDALAMHATFAGIARRVVAISSCDVYRAFDVVNRREAGKVHPVPINEDAPLRRIRYPHRDDDAPALGDPRRWKWDYDKILVEQVVMGDDSLSGTILRLPFVYGPHDYLHRLRSYLVQMTEDRRVIRLDARLALWQASRGYVENVAVAIVLASTDDRAQGRIYNVAEPDALTEQEWVRQIGVAAGWAGEVIAVPANELPERERAQLNAAQPLILDTARIRQELGYTEAVTRANGLREAVAWERLQQTVT